jgi:hypothetical protein
MVSNTTSGGGIRNGLKTNEDRNCHAAKAMTIDPINSNGALRTTAFQRA